MKILNFDLIKDFGRQFDTRDLRDAYILYCRRGLHKSLGTVYDVIYAAHHHRGNDDGRPDLERIECGEVEVIDLYLSTLLTETKIFIRITYNEVGMVSVTFLKIPSYEWGGCCKLKVSEAYEKDLIVPGMIGRPSLAVLIPTNVPKLGRMLEKAKWGVQDCDGQFLANIHYTSEVFQKTIESYSHPH